MSKHTAINNSTSKQLFSFSKSERFPMHKSLNNKVSYETKSEFQREGSMGNGRPFFHTSTRFSYYASPNKTGKLPSPLHYNLGHTFGEKSFKTNQQYSFGVGRDNMRRIFIEDIKKKGDNSLPGPGRYNPDKGFQAYGTNYSMASRLPTEQQCLDKSKKLPGPGSYVHSEITGKNLLQSHIKTESKFSFGKANDRFNVPTYKIGSPAPNVYKPMNNLNENYNSTFTKAQQTAFGKDKSSIINQHFKLNVKNPGPGQYAAFSDFSGTH